MVNEDIPAEGTVEMWSKRRWYKTCLPEGIVSPLLQERPLRIRRHDCSF